MLWIRHDEDLRTDQAELRIGGQWIGAVVTKDVRGYTVVAGVPARIVGERS